MHPSLVIRSGRSAWKGKSLSQRPTTVHAKSLNTRTPGPYFVAFPNLGEALQNNIPIKTQARSCTILPNFVGYVHRVFPPRDLGDDGKQNPVYGPQREGLCPGPGDTGYGGAQTGGVCDNQEEVYI